MISLHFRHRKPLNSIRALPDYLRARIEFLREQGGDFGGSLDAGQLGKTRGKPQTAPTGQGLQAGRQLEMPGAGLIGPEEGDWLRNQREPALEIDIQPAGVEVADGMLRPVLLGACCVHVHRLIADPGRIRKAVEGEPASDGGAGRLIIPVKKAVGDRGPPPAFRSQALPTDLRSFGRSSTDRRAAPTRSRRRLHPGVRVIAPWPS